MKAYQLRILLPGTKPTIWRRILVLGDMSLARLHSTFQVVMGWKNSHIHRFKINGTEYSDKRFELGEDVVDEGRVILDRLGLVRGSRFLYEYDLGDDWQHEVEIEQVLSVDSINAKGVCLAGERRCPPEDCGGPIGYAELLKAMANPTTEEHFELLEWIGRRFDPEKFNLEAVNRKLGVRKVEP